MQALHYITLNLWDFILRSVVEYNYGAQNTVIYEVKKPCSTNKAFSVLQI